MNPTNYNKSFPPLNRHYHSLNIFKLSKKDKFVFKFNTHLVTLLPDNHSISPFSVLTLNFILIWFYIKENIFNLHKLINTKNILCSLCLRLIIISFIVLGYQYILIATRFIIFPLMVLLIMVAIWILSTVLFKRKLANITSEKLLRGVTLSFLSIFMLYIPILGYNYIYIMDQNYLTNLYLLFNFECLFIFKNYFNLFTLLINKGPWDQFIESFKSTMNSQSSNTGFGGGGGGGPSGPKFDDLYTIGFFCGDLSRYDKIWPNVGLDFYQRMRSLYGYEHITVNRIIEMHEQDKRGTPLTDIIHLLRKKKVSTFEIFQRISRYDNFAVIEPAKTTRYDHSKVLPTDMLTPGHNIAIIITSILSCRLRNYTAAGELKVFDCDVRYHHIKEFLTDKEKLFIVSQYLKTPSKYYDIKILRNRFGVYSIDDNSILVTNVGGWKIINLMIESYISLNQGTKRKSE